MPPFARTGTKTPTNIGEITITLHDPDGVNANRSIRGNVVVKDQAGAVLRAWSGDLQPHLTANQLTALAGFLDSLRTQAAAELL